MPVRDTIQRRVMPRTIVALSTFDAPAKAVATARRARGGRGTVTLYLAFDDPYGAVALLGLRDRLAGRAVDLRVAPVIARGIPGDPAVGAKREYAVIDSARLLRRDGRTLARTASVPAGATAFLAHWTASLPTGDPARAAFAAAAMEQLWLRTGGPVVVADYAELWAAHTAAPLPPTAGTRGVADAERAMRRRGLYDTPTATVHGEWFFAHERLDRIAARLDDLGWTVTR